MSLGDKIVDHPSFGMVGASHVSSTGTKAEQVKTIFVEPYIAHTRALKLIENKEAKTCQI